MNPVKIFVAYADSDEAFRKKFSTFLAPKLGAGRIDLWDKSEVTAGQEEDIIIREHINNAQILLLLVSSELLASEEHLNILLERHFKGESIIIPIIWSNCLWEETDLHIFKPLPGKDRTLDSWGNLNDGLKVVADGIDRCVKTLEDLNIQFNKAVEEAESHFSASRWNKAYDCITVALQLRQRGFRPPIEHLMEMKEACTLAMQQEKEQIARAESLKGYQKMYTQANNHFKEKKWLKAKLGFEKIINHYGSNFIPEVIELKRNLDICNKEIQLQSRKKSFIYDLWQTFSTKLLRLHFKWESVGNLTWPIAGFIAIVLFSMILLNYEKDSKPKTEVIPKSPASIRPEDNIPAIIDYLVKYPDGPLATSLRARLKQLNIDYEKKIGSACVTQATDPGLACRYLQCAFQIDPDSKEVQEMRLILGCNFTVSKDDGFCK